MSPTVPPSSRPPLALSVGQGRQHALILFRQGRLEEARACLEQALAMQPDDAELCNNLGVILAEQARHAEALAYYERAVWLQPTYPHAHHNHGNALRRLGRLEEALASYAEAARLDPEAADACNNQGITLLDLGRAGEAAASFREALRRRPDHSEAHTNLGVALAEQGHLSEAAAIYQQVLRRQPRSAEAHNNLGVALAGQGQLSEAIACYRRALELKADYAEAYNNLGNALRQQGELPPAAAALQEALRLKPGYAEACNNLAIVQLKQGKLTSALDAYDQALRLQPDYAEAHVNRALACLLQGDFTQGWPEYEWRWRLKDAARRSFAQPRWDGSPLQGRSILLHAEQGLGDTVQFIRYAPLVRQRGGVVLVEAPATLLPLLQRCPGIDQLLPAGGPLPAFDVQTPFLSLPALFHTTLDTIPAAVPYLSAEPERVQRWSEEARSWKGFKVGIAWQGSPKYRDDHHRSIPLKHFEVLARVPGVRLLSLQKGFGREQLAAVAREWQVLDLGERLDESGGAFVDTAAVMRHLDLVITSDTAIAHLAGALTVPAWVVLPYACDWRWLREREDSPWYPTLRLFRQQRWGDWDEVFARVAEELRRQQARPDAPRPTPSTIADAAGLHRQGKELCRQGRFTEAIACFRRALQVRPHAASTYNNLGVALRATGQVDEAIACYQRALELNADYPAPYNNLGNVFRQQGELDRAAEALQHAVRLKPRYAEAYNNLAVVRVKQGDLPAALAAYDEAVRLEPDYADARANRALAWLLCGDFERGWPEYEWRWRRKETATRSFAQPRWDGSPLQGRSILLHAEQGLGDTVQFIRYAPLVRQRGGVVLVEAPATLLPLLQRCPGIDQLLPAGVPLPVFDVQTPLLSLPALFHTTLDTIPATVPYLSAEPERVERWGQQLRALPGFKVGIAWQGSPKYRDDRHRSIPLKHFEVLVRVPGVRLVSLQKGFGREQLAAVAREWNVLDLGERLDESGGAFVDTAAVMRHLDLVITSDTAIAHLAGALAVPAWVVLPSACDWRWLREREDSPWYPTLRLFRQQRWGDWDEVFARVAQALAQQRPEGAVESLGPPTRPEQPQPCNNLAVALAEQGRLDEAADMYQQVLRRHPHSAEVHNNLGIVRLNQGNLEAALAAYQEALRLRPDFAAASANRAWVWLLQGDYERGWPEYEQNCKSTAGPRIFRQPRWQGEPLHGRTILLHAEYGLGDTLHLIRYASLVRQRDAVVLAEVPPPLVPLLRSCPGIESVLPVGEPLPDFDVQAPLLSLPGIFHTTLETVPADVPYLAAPADRIELWGKELRSLQGFRVGIVWQGNPNYSGDRHRSIPLKHFEVLARMPGVRLVSLQKGFGREQLAAVAREWNVLDLGERVDESGGAFVDTAAVMRHLDMVITSDTAIAHLAGALAVPAWVVLPYACDWRWLREREDSPWYPTLRLFRQQHLGDWDEVFRRLAQALHQQVAAAAGVPSTDAAALRKRGRELCGQGRHGEAIACLRLALRLAPESAPTYNNLGVALTRQGRAAEAIHACRQALRRRPRYAEAHHNLGEALRQQGKLAEARVCYEEALRLKPGLAATRNSLGAVLAAQGELQAACQHYQEAVRLQPDLAAAHHNLALALEKLGDTPGACRHHQQALEHCHDSPAAYLSLGDERARQGQHAEAEASYRLALQLQPESADAWARLGRVLAQQGNLDEAIRCFETGLRLRPEDAELLQNLGDALRRPGRLTEAESCYRRALRVQPHSAYLHNHLGITLIEQSRPGEAESCFRVSIARKADHAPAHNNLGVALEQLGRLGEALSAYKESLRLDPHCADTHKNLALAQLLSGDFEQGWPEYEWRWQCAKAGRRSFAQPRWDGSPLAGRTILLHAEQGLGDTLQFIRYAPLVRQRGGVVLAEVQPPLLPLLRRCPGIDRLLPGGAPLPDYDVQAPLLSLPSLLHTTLATVPAGVPYLSADPLLVERWQGELCRLDGFKIGIAWQGSSKYAGDKHRSIPLCHFAALARLPGVRLVSLQKGRGHEQLAAVAQTWQVLDLGERLDESGGAFVDTAAVMQHLDLVITSDTAIAHLAGALAVPVWVVLPVARDWRWLLEREDSPWYPTMRLIRQQHWGDWDEVFARVAAAVPAVQARAALRQPLMVEVAAGELLDKIAILEIKRARLTDARQRQHVCIELGALQAARARTLREPSELAAVLRELKHINERLWDVEDELRQHEQRQDFGPAFVQRARSVYQLNDRRAQLKRRVNVLCGSVLIEEKSYAGLAGEEAPAPFPAASGT